MKKLLSRPNQEAVPLVLPAIMTEAPRGVKTALVAGMDFSFIRLDITNVSSNKRNVKKEGKTEGEKLFQGLMVLLKDNFPPNEIESEPQYRRYFSDPCAADWFVDVAVDNSGKVIGASLYSYSRQMNLAMLNIVAVDKDSRQQGVASALMARTIERSNRVSLETCGRGIDYIMAEIESLDPSITGAEGRMINHVRPAFHDNTTLIRAIRLQDGSAFTYLLPIMASDQERAEAEKAGEPFEAEPLMFCLRPISKDEKDGISSREVAKLLIWFYKDYLEAECSDMRREEVNELLSITLSKLSGGIAPERFMAFLEKGPKQRSGAIELVPEVKLDFVKIAESGPAAS